MVVSSEKKFKNLVKESDEQEDNNGDVDSASLDDARPTPKKRTEKGWFFFWLCLPFVTLPFVTVP